MYESCSLYHRTVSSVLREKGKKDKLVCILDEHIRELHLRSIDVLTSNHDRQLLTPSLRLIIPNDIPQLRRKSSRKCWKRRHSCIEFVQILHAVEILQNLRRDGRSQPENRNFSIFFIVAKS